MRAESIVLAVALLVVGCETNSPAPTVSSQPKSFDFCLKGWEGVSYSALTIPTRRAVEQRLRDRFLTESPYATESDVNAFVATEIEPALEAILDRRDRQLDSSLRKVKSVFLQKKSLLSALGSVIAFQAQPLCYVVQRRRSDGQIDYDPMCLQEFTLTTTRYRGGHPDERRAVHDNVIQPAIGSTGSYVYVRPYDDAATCRTWTHGSGKSFYRTYSLSDIAT